MSTGIPPTSPAKAGTEGKSGEAEQAVAPVAAEPAAPQESPFNLAHDMARVIEGQVDIIVQRLAYHSQIMLGVSAYGTDTVNGQVATMTVARALREGTPGMLVQTLVNLGDPQIAQINDHTLPYKFNAQVAGLLEGILVDTVSEAYKDNPSRRREARATLEQLFIQANEEMQKQPKAMLAFLAPGPSPNARR
jgi:hypothetical protein